MIADYDCWRKRLFTKLFPGRKNAIFSHEAIFAERNISVSCDVYGKMAENTILCLKSRGYESTIYDVYDIDKNFNHFSLDELRMAL